MCVLAKIMLKYAKIGNLYALNTKKKFILSFDFIYPLIEIVEIYIKVAKLKK